MLRDLAGLGSQHPDWQKTKPTSNAKALIAILKVR
jgi:hypothetical protein